MRSRAALPDKLTVVLTFLLAAATVMVYLPITSHNFIELDDDIYVTKNPRVLGGLTREGIVWAFSDLGYASNWHPLTWLSHMLDVELFGLAAGGHHITNLVVHLAATVLLFLFLLHMTGARIPSAGVAALFALHPLHVESVAWVSERKDVLSAFLSLMAMAAWLGWVRRPRALRYLAALCLFGLALLSKPMAVTIPFLLLLLDWWPLGRMPRAEGGGWFAAVPRLLFEKLPFFFLTAVSAWVTVQAQQKAMIEETLLPFGQRATNGLLAYGVYLWKMVWPSDLAPFYPFPAHSWTPRILWEAAASGLAILCVTVAAVYAARRVPYLVVGWLWYLGMLVPVIGLVQVGMQSRADRYTYLPIVGVFIVFCFAVETLTRVRPAWRAGATAASIVILAALGASTRIQVRIWRESSSVLEQILRVNSDDWSAPGIASIHLNYGAILMDRERTPEAAKHFLLAVRGRPDWWRAHFNLGNAYAKLGRSREAEAEYQAVIRIDPRNALTWNNMGVLLHKAGKTEEAAGAYGEVIRLDPKHAGAHFNLGMLLAGKARSEEAAAHFREALRLQPDYRAARVELDRLTQTRSGP